MHRKLHIYFPCALALWCIVTCLTTHAFAQTTPLVSTTSNPKLKTPLPPPSQPMALSLAYFSEATTRPGISLGIERHLGTTLVTRRQPLPFRHTRHISQRFLLAQLSGYHRPKNHLSTMLLGGFGVRRITRQDVKFEAISSLGYMHIWRYGTTYAVNDAGELEKRRLATSPKFAVLLALGFGKDLNWRAVDPTPLAWHVRPGILLEMPYNTTILPHFTLESGVTYRFGASSP